MKRKWISKVNFSRENELVTAQSDAKKEYPVISPLHRRNVYQCSKNKLPVNGVINLYFVFKRYERRVTEIR